MKSTNIGEKNLPLNVDVSEVVSFAWGLHDSGELEPLPKSCMAISTPFLSAACLQNGHYLSRPSFLTNWTSVCIKE